MATTLVESIQKSLGFPELHKVDPNTQAVKKEDAEITTKNLGQAAIPAVLIGLYKYGNTEQGADDILSGDLSTNWLDLFFTDRKDAVINAVASYAGKSENETAQSMEEVADEAVKIIREQTPDKASFTDVKSYVSQQRTSILVYPQTENPVGSALSLMWIRATLVRIRKVGSFKWVQIRAGCNSNQPWQR